MATHLVFCSACDRDVTLAPRSSPRLWRIVLASAPTEELECLDQGVKCTGALCSYAAPELFDAPQPGRAQGATPS